MVRKALKFGTIFLINIVVKEFIDFILTPIVFIEFGIFSSFIFSTIVYLFVGIISVVWYDKHKTDCLGLEAFKEAQEKNTQIENSNRLIKFILNQTKNNKKKIGLLLSFKNPGLVVIYLRDNHHLYNGFTGKNIKRVFLVNLLLLNLYWNITIYLGYIGFSLREYLYFFFK